MKLTRMLVCVMVMTLGVVSLAEAKGRTASFGGGFSSQVRAAKPAPMRYTAPAPAKNTSFGTFGSGKPVTTQKPAMNYQPSQLSKDLSNNAAKTNALKTADARNNKGNESTNGGFGGGNSGNGNNGTNNGGSGWFRSGNTSLPPSYYSQPVIHQTVVHNNGGFMHGMMWFMLGHSLANHSTQTVYVPTNNQGTNVTPTATYDANGMPLPQAQYAPEEEKESFLMKLLRFVLWIAVITGVIWIVKKILQIRNNKFRSHYNLGSR